MLKLQLFMVYVVSTEPSHVTKPNQHSLFMLMPTQLFLSFSDFVNKQVHMVKNLSKQSALGHAVIIILSCNMP